MTVYELVQRLIKFPPDTLVSNSDGWEGDVVLADYTHSDGAAKGLVLSNSSLHPLGSEYRVEL